MLTFIFIKSNGSVYVRNFLPAVNLRGIFQVIEHLGKNPSIQPNWNPTCHNFTNMAFDLAVPDRRTVTNKKINKQTQGAEKGDINP